MNRLDITDQRFGRLVVLSDHGNDKQGRAVWRCLCDCGNLTYSSGYNLRNGNTTSCGKCVRVVKNGTLDHGYFRTITNNSAYIAGLIASDGNVSSKQLNLNFKNSPESMALLTWVANELKSSLPLYFSKNSIIFNISSVYIVQALADIYNITPKKSLNLCPPNLEERHMRYYLFGLYMGDGCLHKVKGISQYCSIATGSKFMQNWLMSLQFFTRLSVISACTNKQGMIDLMEYFKPCLDLPHFTYKIRSL